MNLKIIVTLVTLFLISAGAPLISSNLSMDSIFIENDTAIYDVISVKSKWNLISLPFNQSVNKTDFIVRCDSYDYSWQEAVNSGIIVDVIYGWDRSTQNYEIANILSPGFGYWIYAYIDCEILENVVDSIDDDFITDLLITWNVVGLPYNKSLHIHDLIIRCYGRDYSWYDATTSNNEMGAPIIVDFIYGWYTDGQYYYILDEMVIPTHGYWMYAYYNCSLRRRNV